MARWSRRGKKLASSRLASVINMARLALLLLAASGAAVAMALLVHQDRPSSTETVFQPPSRLTEPGPVCPWREPESDLKTFFPDATHSEPVTLILSGKRLE